jgi:RecJ-like exonuclease
MKKCKYCNGTGRKPNKLKPKGANLYGWGYNCNEPTSERCPKCYGKGVK